MGVTTGLLGRDELIHVRVLSRGPVPTQYLISIGSRKAGDVSAPWAAPRQLGWEPALILPVASLFLTFNFP